MGLDTASVRISTMRTVGLKLEAMRDDAERHIEQYKGARNVLAQLEKRMAPCFEYIEQDISKGELDKMGEPLLVAQYAKTWLNRVQVMMHALVEESAKGGIRAEGKLEGFEAAIQYAKSFIESEEAQIMRLQQLVSSGEVVIEEDGGLVQAEGVRSRPPGVRPAPSIKQQRQAEELVAHEGVPTVETKTTTAPEETVPTTEETGTTTEAPAEAPKKGRRRKARGNGVPSPDADDAG